MHGVLYEDCKSGKKLSFLIKVMAESMWRATGWACGDHKNAVHKVEAEMETGTCVWDNIASGMDKRRNMEFKKQEDARAKRTRGMS